MKNRGYTLLEVLGVIIILALLTTLVFPSIINSIKKSSSETDNLSMDLISNAADLYIENHTDFIKYNGNKYEIKMEDLIDSDNLPDSIKISDIDNINEKCVQVTYEDDNVNYELKDKGTCIEYIKFDSMCTYLDNGVAEKTAGAKYKCKVSPDRAYNFFVLTTPASDATTIDLIMDRNIIFQSKWASGLEYGCGTFEDMCSLNDKGPVTAIKKLHEATKDWSNVPNIEMDYIDENVSPSGTFYEQGYGKIKTIGAITNIIITDGTIVASYENLKARMPYYSEVSQYNGTNAYLYDYLEDYGIQTNIDSGTYGYWLLSTLAQSSDKSFTVFYDGSVYALDVWNINQGVRPVITLPL